MQQEYFTSKKRLLSLLVAAIFLFSIIFFRLAHIQIVWGKDLQQKATSQWQRSVPLKANRGDIVDTNGVLLATTNTTYTVYARPQSIPNKEQCATKLCNVLQMDYGQLLEKISKRGVIFRGYLI